MKISHLITRVKPFDPEKKEFTVSVQIPLVRIKNFFKRLIR
jgi:hypothetical protein